MQMKTISLATVIVIMDILTVKNNPENFSYSKTTWELLLFLGLFEQFMKNLSKFFLQKISNSVQ
jgi:hypothetical protein